MKRRELIFIFITLIFIIATSMAFIYNNNNDYVLKVNGEKVSKIDFERNLKMQKATLEMATGRTIDWTELNVRAGVPNIDIAKEAAKDFTVETVVEMQEAKRRKISLTDDEKKSIGLEAISNYEEIGKEFGLTLEEFEKIYQENAIINKLALEVVKEKSHYDARHILFDTREMTEEQKEETRQKAQSVLDRIKNGEEIGTLAKEFSDDPGSKDNGGLYTVISKGAFVKEFEDAALSLQDGDLYPELVESAYGYHIIKLETANSKITELTQDLYYNEFLADVKEWVEKAEVKIGEQYYLIGTNEESPIDIKSNEEVIPDVVEPDKE